MIITHFSLVLFTEDKVQDKSYYTLVFCSGLEFLEQIKRTANEPNIIKMYWTQNNKPVSALKYVGLGTYTCPRECR